MTREEKNIEIDSLAQQFSEFPNFYITNVESLNSEKTSKLRRLCYSKNVKLRVAKNNSAAQISSIGQFPNLWYGVLP